MVTALLLALAAPQIAAGGPEPACPAMPVPLPSGLEGWARPVSISAGADRAHAAALTLGRAATARLLPTPRVTYAAAPEKPGAAATSGGVFAFTVAAAGRYRVALGSAAWVDVVSGTAVLASVAHLHGPACSSIRKMVDFDLKPGKYLLQIAGSAAPTLTLMVTRQP